MTVHPLRRRLAALADGTLSARVAAAGESAG